MSSRVRAAVGSAAFLIVAPGVVIGLLPWVITGWQQGAATPMAMVAVGAVLTAAGCAVLLQAFGQFVFEGVGTPAPPAPTRQLVTRGLYRYVRNPMYLAVLTAICGQVLILDRPILLLYALVVAVAFVAFVRFYEQPALAHRYGAQYREYCQQVPAWLPGWPGRRSHAP
jgi:protein-S-isoprenylcysteine O-methyltransferase Ste14